MLLFLTFPDFYLRLGIHLSNPVSLFVSADCDTNFKKVFYCTLLEMLIILDITPVPTSVYVDHPCWDSLRYFSSITLPEMRVSSSLLDNITAKSFISSNGLGPIYVLFR